MAIRPNTTCDIYRAGNSPPNAPDLAAVPCWFTGSFDLGRERGEEAPQKFRFCARLWVNPTVDIRDQFNDFTGNTGGQDTVYIPDRNGVGYIVNFVERVALNQPSDAKCAYIDRKSVTWPMPGPAVMALNPNIGPATGGTIVTITGRYFLGTTIVNFGSVPAISFTINSSSQITATTPAEVGGVVDVTITTPIGISSAQIGDKFTFNNNPLMPPRFDLYCTRETQDSPGIFDDRGPRKIAALITISIPWVPRRMRWLLEMVDQPIQDVPEFIEKKQPIAAVNPPNYFGSTCSTAGSIPIGTTASGSLAAGPNSAWTTFPLVSGKTYTITCTFISGSSILFSFYTGSSCGSQTLRGSRTFTGTIVYGPVIDATGWVSITNTPANTADTFSIQVTYA